MKYFVACAALALLPACMGSGGDDVTVGVDTAANQQLGALLADVRTGDDVTTGDPLSALTYHPGVGQIAQDHAQDMFDRDYVSIYELGSTGCGGINDACDMGDDLNAQGLRWEDILQMVAEGDMTVQQVYQEFLDNGSSASGDNAAKWDDIKDTEGWEFFGLGKAGSGADQKWALLIVWPSGWSDR